MADPAWLIEARKHIGVKEVDGPDSNPTIMKMFRTLGLSNKDDSSDTNAWCSVFLCYCCEVTGFQSPKRQGTRYWRNFSGATKLDKFRVGCICAFWMDAPDKNPGHCGFGLEESSDGKYVYILDGNSGNSVKARTKMPKKQLWGYYWPQAKAGAGSQKPKDKNKPNKQPQQSTSWLDYLKSWF